MKAVAAELLNSVVSVYDQTKTTIFGRVLQSVVQGKSVLGPPLNRYIDPVLDTTVAPAAQTLFLTSNGRLFVMSAEASGLVSILCYTFNLTTGVSAYVGRIQINLPDVAATTTTFRSIKVLDNGVSGWKFLISTTGSVLLNGGTFLVNNIALSDFVQTGFPTIPFATGNNQKAVYFMQDPAATGAGHLQTASAGSAFNPNTNRLYVHNGVAATHQYYVFDTSISPTYTTLAATGVAATDVISCAGHTFAEGDPVTFVTLTGGAGLAVATTYFVRLPVAGVSFQLSTTTGGTIFNFTTDISAATIGRAFGTSHSNFLHKTGNLPALTGTLLLTDSEDYALPQHTALTGLDCVFFATSTVLYMGRMDELTAGAVTWPSLISANTVGAPNEIIAPTLTGATWSNALDKAIYTTGLIFMMKGMVNNQIDVIFGGTNNKWFEGKTLDVVELQPGSAISALDIESGWMVFLTTTVTGQRGVFSADLRSDSLFGYSYMITKVLSTPQSVYKFITTVDQLYDYTGSLKVSYRTSGFGSASGGWVQLPFAQDLEGITTAGDQVQFKIEFSTLGLDTCIPAQLIEFFLGYKDLTGMSDYWDGSRENSTGNADSPAYSAFRLKRAYSGSVPKLYFRALDDSGSVLVTANTVDNASSFQYSTNNGTSWNALGTIPNVALTTELRYAWALPPGVRVTCSLKES